MSENDFRKGIAMLVGYAAAFSIQTDEQMLDFAYRSACMNIPADLFLQAIRTTLASWKSDFRLPTPAIIRDRVKEDIRLRNIALKRMQEAQAPKALEDQTITPTAEMDLIIAETKAALKRANPIDTHGILAG